MLRILKIVLSFSTLSLDNLSGWTCLGILNPLFGLCPASCCYNDSAYTDVSMVERLVLLSLMLTVFSGCPATTTIALTQLRRLQIMPFLTPSVVWFLFCFRVPQCSPRLTHQVALCCGLCWS